LEDNIRMNLKEIGINTRNWVDSAQDRDYWRVLVNAALSGFISHEVTRGRFFGPHVGTRTQLGNLRWNVLSREHWVSFDNNTGQKRDKGH
jgi:hypothetical protein